jgi:ATP-dependent DNA helicase PIF1
LQTLWKDVRYLVIDEISMISAELLSDISQRLNVAKYGRNTNLEDYLPFGGFNVIFTGDLAQLKPVRKLPVFSHYLVQNPDIQTMQTARGQNNLYGAYLWQQVHNVVQLRTNMRQNRDMAYADLLNRL